MATTGWTTTGSRDLYPLLTKEADELVTEFDLISESRKESLQELAVHIHGLIEAGKEVNITVICTHNSRRSHMGQLWALAAAEYYNIQGVNTFSGGTEGTAFHQNAVDALVGLGFEIDKMEDSNNPIYEATVGPESGRQKMFSKKYDDPFNPQQEFIAIMVCTDADEACPIVRGANFRLSLPFEDPKAFDGTDQAAAKYRERSRDIGREMLYTFSKVRDLIQ